MSVICSRGCVRCMTVRMSQVAEAKDGELAHVLAANANLREELASARALQVPPPSAWCPSGETASVLTHCVILACVNSDTTQSTQNIYSPAPEVFACNTCGIMVHVMTCTTAAASQHKLYMLDIINATCARSRPERQNCVRDRRAFKPAVKWTAALQLPPMPAAP